MLTQKKMNDDRGKKRMKDFQAPRYLVPIIVGMSVICIFLFIMKYYFGGTQQVTYKYVDLRKCNE